VNTVDVTTVVHFSPMKIWLLYTKSWNRRCNSAVRSFSIFLPKRLK